MANGRGFAASDTVSKSTSMTGRAAATLPAADTITFEGFTSPCANRQEDSSISARVFARPKSAQNVKLPDSPEVRETSSSSEGPSAHSVAIASARPAPPPEIPQQPSIEGIAPAVLMHGSTSRRYAAWRSVVRSTFRHHGPSMRESLSRSPSGAAFSIAPAGADREPSQRYTMPCFPHEIIRVAMTVHFLSMFQDSGILAI